MVLANVGVPLISVLEAFGWLTIIPVVIVEALVAKVLLRWTLVVALKWVSLANLASTLLGIPIAWFFALVVSVLTGGGDWGDGSILGVVRSPAWFGPGYIPDLSWAIPLALSVLLVPCYVMSCLVEFAFLRRAGRELGAGNTHSLWEYAWKANLVSYLSLAVVLLLILTTFAVSR